MLKIVLILAVCASALAGGHGHGGHGQEHGGWGHGGHGGHGQSGWGHGHGGHGGHGQTGWGHGHGGHGGHGHGWKQYHGWANVNSHQTPYSYNFGVQESGKGWNKWVWQGADTHHVTPVYGHGWGHQG